MSRLDAFHHVTDMFFVGQGMRFLLRESVQRAMCRAATEVFPLETAGPLFGVYAASCQALPGQLDTAIVVDAPVAVKCTGPYTCETDTELMQRMCDERWPHTYYLETWHTHPGASPAPSKTDLDTLRAHAADPKQSCPEQLLVILGGLRVPLWSVHVTKGGQVFELMPLDGPEVRETIALFGAAGRIINGQTQSYSMPRRDGVQ